MNAPTPVQQDIIRYGQGNVLVSAAAGSGKTTVMVARILRLITEERVELNRLLVVTFTDAATANMRAKIYELLEKEAEKNPDDAFLQAQLMSVSSCKVQTIHSFCLSVVKDYQSRVPDLDPGFAICDPTEAELMRKEALGKAIESLYRDAEEDPEHYGCFLKFSRNFGGKRGDAGIEDLILSVHKMARDEIDPEGWLTESVQAYAPENAANRAEAVKDLLKDTLEQALFYLRSAVARYGLLPDNVKTASYAPSDRLLPLTEKIDALTALLGSWDSQTPETAVESIRSLSWPRFSLSSLKNDPELNTIRTGVSAAWNAAKKLLNDEDAFRELLSCLDPDPRQAADTYEMMQGLRLAVLRLDAFYTGAKNRRARIDFNDFEHHALSILLDRDEEGRLVPSDAALSLRESFDYIFIDEYQDSNPLQELILNSVARQTDGRSSNIFMVGDVKQSIYRFRSADPSLFREKSKLYSLTDEPDAPGRLFLLANNFRSEIPILDSVNYIFEVLLNGRNGNIDYVNQALIPPEGKPDSGVSVTLTLFEDKAKDAALTEARHTAKKIKALLEQGVEIRNKGEDRETRPTRPIRPSDIVILLRSARRFDAFREALEAEGLRALCESSEDYFKTEEVMSLRRILNVIDNPRQDIELVSVLHSAPFFFTAEELGQIRLFDRKNSYYEALSVCAREDPETLGERCRAFLARLADWRRASLHLGVHDLLWMLYLDTRIYLDAAEDSRRGRQRRANLDRLLELAIRFENSSLSGLYQFLRYLDQIEKFKQESGEINVSDGNAEAVRIMTIHKSKGLEYPCVFLPLLGHAFNNSDKTAPLVIDQSFGLGTKSYSPKKAGRKNTVERMTILNQIRREDLREEMRVLYVAMTRAEELLCLSGCLTKGAGHYQSGDALCFDTDEYGSDALPDEILYAENDYLGWILQAIALQEAKGKPHPFLKLETAAAEETDKDEGPAPAESAPETSVPAPAPVRKTDEDPGARFTWQYPFRSESALKARYSVSEIKKEAYSEEEAAEEAESEPLIVLPFSDEHGEEPASPAPDAPKAETAEERKARGARKGTVMHAFFALADWARVTDEAAFERECERLTAAELFSAEDAELLRKYKKELLLYRGSKLCERMLRSSRVWKEQPFLLSLTVAEMKELAPGWLPAGAETLPPDARLMVQGIIDLFFEEDGALVLADYKTDRTLDENALGMYGLQLELYKLALERILHRPVREKLLYGTRKGEEIYV